MTYQNIIHTTNLVNEAFVYYKQDLDFADSMVFTTNAKTYQHLKNQQENNKNYVKTLLDIKHNSYWKISAEGKLALKILIEKIGLEATFEWLELPYSWATVAQKAINNPDGIYNTKIIKEYFNNMYQNDLKRLDIDYIIHTYMKYDIHYLDDMGKDADSIIMPKHLIPKDREFLEKHGFEFLEDTPYHRILKYKNV